MSRLSSSLDAPLSETREVLTGEVVFVADARLHDFEGRATAVEVRFRVLVGEVE